MAPIRFCEDWIYSALWQHQRSKPDLMNRFYVVGDLSHVLVNSKCCGCDLGYHWSSNTEEFPIISAKVKYAVWLDLTNNTNSAMITAGKHYTSKQLWQWLIQNKMKHKRRCNNRSPQCLTGIVLTILTDVQLSTQGRCETFEDPCWSVLKLWGHSSHLTVNTSPVQLCCFQENSQSSYLLYIGL